MVDEINEETSAVIKQEVSENKDIHGSSAASKEENPKAIVNANSGQVTIQTGTVDQFKEFQSVLYAYRFKEVIVLDNKGNPYKFWNDETEKHETVKVRVIVGKKDVAASSLKVVAAITVQFLASLVKAATKVGLTAAFPGVMLCPAVGTLMSILTQDLPGAIIQHFLSDGLNLLIDYSSFDVKKTMVTQQYTLTPERLQNCKLKTFDQIRFVAFNAFIGSNDVIHLFASPIQFAGKFLGYVLKDFLLGAFKKLEVVIDGFRLAAEAAKAIYDAVMGYIRELLVGAGAELEKLKEKLRQYTADAVEKICGLLETIKVFAETAIRRMNDWCVKISTEVTNAKDKLKKIGRKSIEEVKDRKLKLPKDDILKLINQEFEESVESEAMKVVEKIEDKFDGVVGDDKSKFDRGWKLDVEENLEDFAKSEPESEVQNAVLSPFVERIGERIFFRESRKLTIDEIFPPMNGDGWIPIEDEDERNLIERIMNDNNSPLIRKQVWV